MDRNVAKARRAAAREAGRGRRVWGTCPFQEAAFLGGKSTIRLGRENRFAGDAALYGNAELRVQLAEIFLLLPWHFGLLGLGDAGRVFYAADPPGADTWHTAVGGGGMAF